MDQNESQNWKPMDHSESKISKKNFDGSDPSGSPADLSKYMYAIDSLARSLSMF